MNEINLMEFIDWMEIFYRVKKNQLEEYPTAKEYIKFLKSIDEDYSYVKEMYARLNTDLSYLSVDTEEHYIDEVYKDGFLYLELSIGGNDSNEGGDNFWGYGYEFKINLEYGTFEGYVENNYC